MAGCPTHPSAQPGLHLGELGIAVGDLVARCRQRGLDARHVVAVHRIDVALHLQRDATRSCAG